VQMPGHPVCLGMPRAASAGQCSVRLALTRMDMYGSETACAAMPAHGGYMGDTKKALNLAALLISSQVSATQTQTCQTRLVL
jgi:hypothetical protein